MNDVERFWTKVNKKGENDCWEWTASVNEDGYGRIGFNGNKVYAHRVSHIIHHPLTINLLEGHSDICVCHKCDNRRCVNPAHLFLGSNADNMKDRDAKGRGNSSKGENHYSSKLTENDVREIRKKYADGGVLQRELALEYGVGQTAIAKIIHRKRWKHI